MSADITHAMGTMLASLGFESMAREVIGEADGERLGRYARVIIRNSPRTHRARLLELFNSQNIYPDLC